MCAWIMNNTDIPRTHHISLTDCSSWLANLLHSQNNTLKPYKRTKETHTLFLKEFFFCRHLEAVSEVLNATLKGFVVSCFTARRLDGRSELVFGSKFKLLAFFLLKTFNRSILEDRREPFGVDNAWDLFSQVFALTAEAAGFCLFASTWSLRELRWFLVTSCNSFFLSRWFFCWAWGCADSCERRRDRAA